MSKYNRPFSELQLIGNCRFDLIERILQLERNNVMNSQYHRRENIEINPIPESLEDDIFEENVCKALFLVLMLLQKISNSAIS